MPMSTGPTGGLPGMTLRAWGLVNTSTNTIIKAFNVASVVGSTINLTAPMASANCAVRVVPMNAGSFIGVGNTASASAVTAAMFNTSTGTSAAGLLYFEVYE